MLIVHDLFDNYVQLVLFDVQMFVTFIIINCYFLFVCVCKEDLWWTIPVVTALFIVLDQQYAGFLLIRILKYIH